MLLPISCVLLSLLSLLGVKCLKARQLSVRDAQLSCVQQSM